MTLIEQRSKVPVKGHPTGLVSLVGIELWERFSFYGMQAILVFYLYAEDGLGLAKQEATALIGAYGAFVYLATIAGGWLSDHLAGPERTLLGGAISVMAGHIVLSLIPGTTGAIMGLLAIGAGSGLLKTCAITTLGLLYSDRPATQKDQGFQLFYLGIQLGAMFGPIFTGYLAHRYSWHAGFGAAAVLMAVGLASYATLRPRMYRQLPSNIVARISTPTSPLSPRNRRKALGGFVIGIACLATGSRWLTPSRLSSILLIVVLCAVIIIFAGLLRSSQVTAIERAKLKAFIPLFLAGAAFWSVSYQNFGVFAVYSDVQLNRMIGTFEIPAAWVQTLNPILVMTLAYPVARFWTVRPNTPLPGTTMSIGLFLGGAAFLLFLPFVGDAPGTTPLLAMVAIALIIAIGELLIGPVCMAATADFAPEAHRTTFSALYFFTFAVGMAASGKLSEFYTPGNPDAETAYFLGTAVTTIALAGALWLWARRRGA